MSRVVFALITYGARKCDVSYVLKQKGVHQLLNASLRIYCFVNLF